MRRAGIVSAAALSASAAGVMARRSRKRSRRRREYDFGSDFDVSEDPAGGVDEGMVQARVPDRAAQPAAADFAADEARNRARSVARGGALGEAEERVQCESDFTRRIGTGRGEASESLCAAVAAGAPAPVAGASFFRSLDAPGVCDRWSTGAVPTASAMASAEFGEWRLASGVGLSNERLGPALRRDYLRDFLRPARESAGERPCAAGNRCQGLLMHGRSHFHVTGGGFVLREMLLPTQSEEFRQTGRLPAAAELCLVCARFAVSKFCKARNMTGTGEYSGMLCPHSVVVGVAGEYEAAACLYAKTLTDGVDRLIPEHADNRYEYKRGAAGPYLEEVGGLCVRLN